MLFSGKFPSLYTFYHLLLLFYIWRVPKDFTALFGSRKILRKENRVENIEEKWKEIKNGEK